jgi:D-alanyl-D-alanine carboxypeptidase
VLGVAVLLVGAAAALAATRINQPLAHPATHAALPMEVAVHGTGPALPWPTRGQGAVAVPSLGYADQSGPEHPVPIASLTKMTNAVVILRDHPLPAGAAGPLIIITAADVAEYDNELHNDESTIPIRFGEVLSERQMLEAMLIVSANDIAYSLAVWDAGSEPAFVAKMNALVASLGATGTLYVDASGYEPGSVSTASDCLRVAAAGMADPTFAEVVAMPSVTLPMVGTLPNIVTEVGSNGVVGVKSGYTSQAGACLILAGVRSVQGRPVLVLAAVLGQPTPPPIVPASTTTTTRPATAPPSRGSSTTTTTTPPNDLQIPDPFRFARPVVEKLLNAAETAVVPVTVATADRVVGAATVTWGGSAHPVPIVTAGGAWLLAWPGQTVASTSGLSPVPPGSTKGSRVGTAMFSLGTQIEVVPLRLASTVPEPSWWWRLVHGP